MSTPIVELSAEHRIPGAIESCILTAKHRLAEYGIFSDDGLVEMMERHPRALCNISMMGTDQEEYEWGDVDTTGFSAEEMLDAVKRGRMWINIRQIMTHQPELRKIVDDLYDELENQSPGFVATRRSANVLISSPNAFVYYHVDVPQNILWHVRGQKKVWVYGEWEEIVPRDVYEAIVDCDREEDVPYRREFDKLAEVYTLEPGQMVTWPQHTPHRVENLDSFNVSLSTEHYSPRAFRKVRVIRANRFLKNKLGLPVSAEQTDGLGFAVKNSAFLAKRSVERYFLKKSEFDYPMKYRLDLNAPNCMVPIDETEQAAQQELVMA
ncbi:cupin-like domain-containing protein [Calycomorphotria hydatis]|uniref:JmjC domain-containing protein n=1 Tax=Calycomorphotria hydatis TaxID=2528027 RepID=A0A517TBC6_9PLAN|nr:cupin-like domain-containing protein [Calycomorphotria hydatis]QDT65678.1 hypothetical protein V22_29380 [Calycomorphotria hydatis]